MRGTAGLLAATALGARAAGEPGREPGPPRIGVVGCGGKGWSGMQWAAEHGVVRAICDIDAGARSKAMLEHPGASTFVDYREMYEAMRGKLDVVVISTPDHHHACASALAMRAGLHTYCEKPLTRTVWEARELAKIARRHKVATQMGNQSTASTPMRKAAAAIRDGAFGAVREIHLWTDRAGGWWRQGIPRPEPKLPPKHVDFDVWLGPSPIREYGDGYHPFAWRGWWDFGTGSLGDMGCHIFNMPFMALGLRDPLAVRATTSGHNRDSFPAWSVVEYEFGARAGHPAFQLFWSDGGKKPAASVLPGEEFGGNGVIVVCERGTVYGPSADNDAFRVIGGREMPDVAVDESPGHMAELFRAAAGGPAAVANFPDYAAPLTETVLLGNLAIWADGPRLEWDARSMRVKGTDEFDPLIRPKARPGWSV